MIKLKDDLNREVVLNDAPKRIVSLVPSLTELLFDLGLEDNIVGVTKFCIHPGHAQKIANRVGGTKKFDFEKIKSLAPDLIIANKEENYKEGIEQLCQDYTVYISDIFDLQDASRTIQNIGKMTRSESSAEHIVSKILQQFEEVKDKLEGEALYFIWHNPNMVAASNTFIDFIMNWLGIRNAARHLERYPELDQASLSKMSPDYILLSSEPFPFKNHHIEQFKMLFPQADILLVDGEMFSWYGSRLQYAPEYFMSLPVNRRR